MLIAPAQAGAPVIWRDFVWSDTHGSSNDLALGEFWTDAAHHAGAEISLDALRRRRRRGLQQLGLELQAVGAIGESDADSVDELAGGD